jgi:hypothetical protein
MFQIEINDPKEIQKEINKIKKDNLNYLKTHADCIYEYHLITNNLFTIKNLYLENMNNFINCNNELSYKINNDFNYEKNYYLMMLTNFLKLVDNDRIERVSKILNDNLDEIKNKLSGINKINKPILLLDCENILRSFKIQYLLKNLMENDEFDELFNIWNYGNFDNFDINYANDYSNISLSEYSLKSKYIEPYTSMSLNIEQKINLINLLITNYLQNFFVVYIITSKYPDYTIFNDNTNIFIPIIYNKNDCREQDDYILLFIYYIIKNYTNEIYLISSDKFKFYKETIKLHDFKFEYNIDEKKINLLIGNSYENDIIKYNSKIYKIPIYNFPLYNFINIFNNLNDKDIDTHILDLNIIAKLLFTKLLDLLETEEFNMINMINIINNLIKNAININSTIKIVYNFLNKKTKKDIFKIIINKQNIFEDDNINNIIIAIQQLKLLINIFIILRCIKFMLVQLPNNFFIKIVKLYSLIIYNYDEIDININKIRKLSNNYTLTNKIFMELNSLYLYIKKIGFLKKNF